MNSYGWQRALSDAWQELLEGHPAWAVATIHDQACESSYLFEVEWTVGSIYLALIEGKRQCWACFEYAPSEDLVRYHGWPAGQYVCPKCLPPQWPPAHERGASGIKSIVGMVPWRRAKGVAG